MQNQLVKIDTNRLTETVSTLPGITSWIQRNHDKGLSAGQTLLDTIEAAGGMTRETYEAAATYIANAKKAASMMNEKRSPVTRLMDEFRKCFTSLESDFNPNDPNTIPGKLQAMRNEFARKEREREEKERREQQAKAAMDAALQRYRRDVADEFFRQADSEVATRIAIVKKAFDEMTISMYDFTVKRISSVSDEFVLNQLLGTLVNSNGSQVPVPMEIAPNVDTMAIRMAVYREMEGKVKEFATSKVKKAKQDYTDLLPNRLRQLQMEAVDAEKAKAEAEAIRKHEEEMAAKAREEQEAQKALADKAAQQQEAMNLFGQIGQQGSDIKTKTKKVIVVKSPEAFSRIIGWWWAAEGSHKTVDELMKEFKKMVTFVEKQANKKDPVFIECDDIEYVDEVVAK